MTNQQPQNDISRPPVPVPGCPVCTELAVLRDKARARSDASAETDANVLLRRHQRHPGSHGHPVPPG